MLEETERDIIEPLLNRLRVSDDERAKLLARLSRAHLRELVQYRRLIEAEMNTREER